MKAFFALDEDGGVPARQQTRVASFLISAHGALARRFALALPIRLDTAWQTELNAQLYSESEIVSLLLRATRWVPDLALGFLAATWEAAWAPAPSQDIPDHSLALAVDLATLAHAVHASIRPAALLPIEINADDPFAMALRRVEFESGRLLQAQIIFLKGKRLVPFRSAVSKTLEARHAEVRKLWGETLASVDISTQRE